MKRKRCLRSSALPQSSGACHVDDVREAKTVSAGDALRLRLWKGTLDYRVEGADEN